MVQEELGRLAPPPERQLETVEALLESAQLLHASLDLDSLLRHLLRSVMGRLAVSRGLIAVVNRNERKLALVRGVSGVSAGEVFDEERARAGGITRIFPIGDPEDPIGLLGISSPRGHSRGEEEVSAAEISFLQALLGIAASGIVNARAHAETRQLNLQLDQKVQELRALLDLVRGLSASFEPEDVAQLLVLTLAGRWAVGRYGLIAWKSGQPLVVRCKGMDLHPLLELEQVREAISDLPEAIRIRDLPPQSRLRNLLEAEQAEVVFPLLSGNEERAGVVALGSRPGGLSYADGDLEFGAGLVAQSAVAFENAWYVRETIERKRLEQELDLAASIQKTLFPAQMPHYPGFDLAAHNRHAAHCGGDYYDILPIDRQDPRGRFLTCVADVSGKGLPASLLMSNMQATLRALLGRIDSLPRLAEEINDLLHATTPSNKYVTAFLVEIDPLTGEARYVNAGHTDGLLLRATGEVLWLKGTGTPLGLLPDLPYEEAKFSLFPGDLLALFSDGVTEAQDREENEFGEARVARLLREVADQPAKSIVERVFAEIDRYAAETPQYDDITLFVVKRTQES
jgi:sigma-B regulation protein RsbU (phosphoserine phosphatase)